MRQMSWREAAEYTSNHNSLNNIVFVIFSDRGCGTCSKFKEDISEFESEEFEVIDVQDGTTMPFPVAQYPTCYVFIPNNPGVMPMIKVGAAPKHVIESDVKVQLEALRTHKDYFKVIEEWAQL